jgi:UDP-2,4-diacetamido-2,4,6-trideoxy-beta-L-altropyranose hydrolase
LNALIDILLFKFFGQQEKLKSFSNMSNNNNRKKGAQFRDVKVPKTKHEDQTGPFVVIIADTGKEVGLGHLRRSMSLGVELVTCGATVSLFAPMEIASTKSVVESAVTVRRLPSAITDIDSLLTITSDADLIIVDTYRLDLKKFMSKAKNQLVVSFVDFDNQDSFGNIAINGSPNALPFKAALDSASAQLFGPRYQIISKDVVTAKLSKKPKRDVRHLLVTMGGSDPMGFLPHLFKWVERNVCRGWPQLTVDFIVGQYVSENFIPTTKNLQVHGGSDGIAKLLATADIAISAGGQTLFELVYCEVPAIAVSYSTDQDANIRSLERLGAISFAGKVSDSRILQSLEICLEELIGSATKRKTLMRQGADIIDGKGALRIAQYLLTNYRCSNRQTKGASGIN